MRIAVLMSTYNGSQYLAEQLDSILNVNQDIEIFIRDDGSVDETINILNKYNTLFRNKIHLDIGSNIGYKKSFFQLLFNIVPGDFDYYFFADQDDIWLPNKVSKSLERFNDSLEPKLVFSNAEIIDNNNIKNGVLLYSNNDIKLGFFDVFMRMNIFGMTIAFNQRLMSMLQKHPPTQEIAHDNWTPLVASACGVVEYIDEPLVFYRQHSHNLLGASGVHSAIPKGFVSKFRKTFGNVKGKLKFLTYQNHHFSIKAQDILEFKKDSHLNARDCELLLKIEKVPKSVKVRIPVALNKKFYGDNYYITRQLIVRTLVGNI